MSKKHIKSAIKASAPSFGPEPIRISGLPKGPTLKGLNRPSTLLSDPGDKINEATAQDCIDDLRHLAEEDTSRVVSRNWYRLNGKYSERAWNVHFGTFHEFKRAAGIILTRPQHRLEKELAKHASVDNYRQMNQTLQGYGENYLKPNGNRFKTILGFCDVHDRDADPFVLRVILDTARRVQPDVICLNGDIFDLPEFGRFTQDPRDWDVVGRIKFVHEQILAPLRDSCPDSQIDFIAGNHCQRLLRHLADSTPAMRAVLSDLHGMTVKELLGLDRYEVNFISRGDLAAFNSMDMRKELMRNHKIYYDCFLAHHFPEGRHLGMPGFCGHHHKLISWPMRSAVFGSYNFYQIGAVHRPSATYCDGENWSSGFLLAHIDSQAKRSCLEYVDIKDFAVVGGKYYMREKIEV